MTNSSEQIDSAAALSAEDVMTFKLHDGDPGPDCDQNLFLGDGLPQQWSQDAGGDVTFTIPDLGEARPEVTICAVSAWSNDKGMEMFGVLPKRRVVMRSGDAVTLTKLGPPWFQFS